MTDKPPRKPAALKGWSMRLAGIDSSNNAYFAHVGWSLSDAKKLHAWLGKFIAWKQYMNDKKKAEEERRRQ